MIHKAWKKPHKVDKVAQLIEKIYDDYLDYKYDLEQVGIFDKSEIYPIKSPFPPESTDKKEIARPDLISDEKIKSQILRKWMLKTFTNGPSRHGKPYNSFTSKCNFSPGGQNSAGSGSWLGSWAFLRGSGASTSSPARGVS